MTTPAQTPSSDLLSRVQAIAGSNPAPGATAPPVMPPEPSTAPDDLVNRVGQVAKQGTSFDPQKQQESATPEDYLSKTEDVIHNVASDVGQMAAGVGKTLASPAIHLGNAITALKSGDYSGAAQHFLQSLNSPADEIVDQQLQSSRQAAESMIQSAKAGDVLGALQHAAGIVPGASQVDAAMSNYQKNPNRENLAHVISTAVPLLVPGAMRLAGKAAGIADELAVGKGTIGEEAESSEAVETPKPNLIQKIKKGQSVEQEPAQSALKKAAGTNEPSLQETLTKPIAENQAAADALYEEMDKTGVDVKNLTQKLRNTERKLTQLTDTPEDQVLEAKLLKSREGLIEKIKDSGVSEDQINEADTQFQKTKALSDIQSRIFKNPSVVEGDVTHGTPETVNVDSTIKALRKLENTKYGNRIEQAFGKEGANELFDKLYEAQRMGVHAMKVQQVAKWIGGIIGAGTILAGTEKAIGAVKSSE